MMKDEVVEKASDLIRPVLGRDTSGHLVETVFSIETVTDIRNLRRISAQSVHYRL